RSRPLRRAPPPPPRPRARGRACTARSTRGARRPPPPPSQLLQRRQELDEVAQLALAHLLDEVGEHRRLAALARFDLVLVDEHAPLVEREGPQPRRVLARDAPADDAAAPEVEDRVLEPGRDLRVREDDRLEQVLARRVAADAREVGAGHARPLAADPVAL